VPPVIADVNNDGYDDILMTAFEGRMVLFGGKDLSIIWHKEFPSMETYTYVLPLHLICQQSYYFKLYTHRTIIQLQNINITVFSRK